MSPWIPSSGHNHIFYYKFQFVAQFEILFVGEGFPLPYNTFL